MNSFSKGQSFDIDGELRRGVHHHEMGQFKAAEEAYRKILAFDPNHSDSSHLLGLIAHQSCDYDGALTLISKAIRENPNNPIYYNSLGTVFRTQGKLSEAISCFEKALKLKPDYGKAYNNIGNAFLDQNRLGEAISSFQKAVELNPALPEGYNGMGNTFIRQDRPNEAISCFEKAIKLQPAYAVPYLQMGNFFMRQGHLTKAISCFEKALKLKPDFHEAYNAMGNALELQDRWDEAGAHYQEALKIRPDFTDACSGLVRQLQFTCAWQELDCVAPKLDDFTKKALVNGAMSPESPFLSIMRHADVSHNFSVARSWSREIAERMSALKTQFLFENRRSAGERIIVGYLSNSFCDHPLAHLMLGLFGLHNRNEFEIICYSYGRDDGSYYRKQIQQDCDKFVDLHNLNYVDAANAIYESQPDILVDLNGHTEGNRLEICALRPAPIQVTYLGFAGTTGADFIDYIITDRIVTPTDYAIHFAEHFVYMPHCYMVSNNKQRVSDRTWKKDDFGLPEDGFILSSFNQPYKIDPKTFDVWIKILEEIPGSVLWLKQLNEIGQRNLGLEARKRGVDPNRLIFAKRMASKEEHLARLRLSDVALDTRIYNGHTTTSDALWAGVPVITIEGNHFASRVSSSILTAVGLPELIAHSLEEYEALAVRWARNPAELEATRQKLSKNRLTEPFFDTARFVTNLEKAYKTMWKIFVAGEKPRQIEVVES